MMRFSSREIYDCEMPSRSATSFCVFSGRPPSLRPALGVEIGECRRGSRLAAAFETLAPERNLQRVDGDAQRGVGREILGESGVEREHHSALRAEKFVDSACGNDHVG